MRIAFVTDSYHPTIDGVVTIVDIIRDSLVKLGHEVFIVAPDPGEKDRIEGVYYFPAIRYRAYEGYFLPIFPSNKIEILEKINPDVIHVYGIALMALKGYIAAYTLKKPYVITMTTMVTDTLEYYLPIKLPVDIVEKFAWIYIRQILNHSSAVITHTQPIMDELKAHGITPRDERIIPAGIDIGTFRPLEDPDAKRRVLGIEGKKVLMHVGRISYEKHIDDIVRALARFGEDTVMVIVGDGPARPEVEGVVDELGLRDRVTFTGFVDRNDLPELYNCADVCISCSRFETQGLSIMEAMACRKPVVCPNARAFSVIITDGKDGFLFDADGGVDELTEAIERALNCDDSVRQNSMETARSYSEENCARMLLDLYADVIEAKKAKLAAKGKP
ncbi:MAG: glycosyltransferase [Candidatus Methanomethylophilaceae archaeon]|nr:glycosyltransferase [Candidatus Methanomethylophilaceae archaeon]